MDILTPDDGWRTGLLTGGVVEFKFYADGTDAADDAGLIEGYASTFDGLDSHNDTIAPGAFADTLNDHKAAGTAPALLWAHRQTEPIGKLTGAGEDGRGLRVRGKLNLKTPAGANAYEHAKAGDVTGLSIGYRVAPRGATFKGGGRQIQKLHLHEVSMIPSPSDSRARILSVKSADAPLTIETKAALESALQDIGLSRAAARKVAGGGWPALNGSADEDTIHLDDIAKRLRTGTLALKSLKGA